MNDMAWLGQKPGCGCPVYAASTAKKRNAPVVPLGTWVGNGKARKFVPTTGTLKMRRVPLDQASVTICRCEEAL